MESAKKYKCIFCLCQDSSKFNTIEHIVPESLGGGSILPDGFFCDSCQNLFGSHIEQQALATYPLINYRTFLGIPTKKGKRPWFNCWPGKIIGDNPRSFILETEKPLPESFSLLIVPAHVEKPDMLLRTLLKIGLELIAKHFGDFVFDERFDFARVYALTGKKDRKISFWMVEDMDIYNDLRNLPRFPLNQENASMAIITDENMEYKLSITMVYLEFIVPLSFTWIPHPDVDYTFREPTYRFVTV